MVNFGQAAVGIILLLIVVSGLLYLFYSRTNAVEKTGYGSLIMLSLVSLMIPAFWIMSSGQQTSAQVQQHSLAVQRGMVLYAQYCVDKCYAIKDGKLADPKYNGFTIDELNQKSDDEIRRIIGGGIYSPTVVAPSNPNLITRSEQYGGPLTDIDVDYMLQFIRSANRQYLTKQGFPTNEKSGFEQLPPYLQNTSPSLYQAAVSLGSAGQFGNAVDMTKQKTITINMVMPPAGASCTPSCYELLNVKVKVGTKITWVNKTTMAHTVTAIVGQNTAAPKIAPNIFDSGFTKGIQSNGTFTYTVTEAAYNFNPDHTVIYYCQYHPMMLAELTIVQ